MSVTASTLPSNYEEYAKTFRSRVFGGVAILFSGVALIFFSGCFLLGILALLESALDLDQGIFVEARWGKTHSTLTLVLFIMSGVSFVGGALLVGKGFALLSRTIAERP